MGRPQGNPGTVVFTALAGWRVLNVCYMHCPGHWVFSSPRKLCEREAATGPEQVGGCGGSHPDLIAEQEMVVTGSLIVAVDGEKFLESVESIGPAYERTIIC